MHGKKGKGGTFSRLNPTLLPITGGYELLLSSILIRLWIMHVCRQQGAGVHFEGVIEDSRAVLEVIGGQTAAQRYS